MIPEDFLAEIVTGNDELGAVNVFQIRINPGFRNPPGVNNQFSLFRYPAFQVIQPTLQDIAQALAAGIHYSRFL